MRGSLVLISLLGAACDETTVLCDDGSLHAIVDTIADADACADRVDAVRGRVGRQSVGSFVLWSRRTEGEQALVASALHTLGAGWYGPVGTEITAALEPPQDIGVLRLQVPPADGALSFDALSPLYDLYHPDVPAVQHTQDMADILPRHDLFVGLTDPQRLPNLDPFPTPEPLQPGPVPLYDPLDATTSEPTFSAAEAGSTALIIGFPSEGPPDGAFSLGTILDDAEALAAIEELAAAGDEEGSIPYDAEVEMLVVSHAEVGMSGGGAFDDQGRWIGVLVRASTTDGVGPYTRVVRATHIAEGLDEAFSTLSEAEQAAVAPFIEPR